MNTAAAALAGRKLNPWLTLAVAAVAAAATWFIVRSALPYFHVSPDRYGEYFWPRRWWLLVHIIGGVIALATGVVQLWLGLTNRAGRLHRWLGRLYVGGIFGGSVAGFFLASTITGNAPYGSGLFMLCVAWVVTTGMALFAIRRRDVDRHRAWVLRSYVVTFAFVTFRFGVDAFVALDLPLRDAQGIMAWACWAVPLLAIEPLLQWPVRGRRQRESRDLAPVSAESGSVATR